MTTSMYVIGDIHGCLTKLEALLDKIKLHNGAFGINTTSELVFVGDYVDRGPDSKGVIELVRSLEANPQAIGFDIVVPLMGNHEDMMTDPSARDVWLWNGGIQCLQSFDSEWHNKSVHEVVGVDTYRWVRSLPIYHVSGSVAVAHAGIDESDLSVEQHSKEELLWSRRLRRGPHDIYKYTVHGHTPMDQAYVGQHVAYIDTGAVFDQGHSENRRKLTALYIPDVDNPDHTKMELIQV